MQVFKTFFKIVKHYLGSMSMYFVIFAIIFFVMSSLGNSNTVTNFTEKKSNISIIDRDQSFYSKELASYLGGLHNLVELKDDTETLQNELYYRSVDYILIIPKGYGDKVETGTFDNLLQNVKVPDSFSGTYVDSQIDEYLQTLKITIQSGVTGQDATKAVADTLSTSTEVTLISGKDSSANDPIMYFYQYYVYVILCVIIVGLGPILIRFYNKDLNDRMSASSLSLKKRNTSLVFCSLLFAFLCWGLFLILAAIQLKDALFTKLGLLCIVNSILFTLICVSITFLVSTFLKKEETLDMVSNTLGLGMSFLCGVFVPASFMSASVVNFSKIFPAYWYMDAHNHFSAYVQTSNGLSHILFDFGIEALYAVALLIIGLVVTKVKRNN